MLSAKDCFQSTTMGVLYHIFRVLSIGNALFSPEMHWKWPSRRKQNLYENATSVGFVEHSATKSTDTVPVPAPASDPASVPE
ncbi:MAG: hypothetical protein PUC41_08470 [Oscillospiraceae bacterium]|nr:hypothetical protein [Oscillospiraceae bacterium]